MGLHHTRKFHVYAHVSLTRQKFETSLLFTLKTSDKAYQVAMLACFSLQSSGFIPIVIHVGCMMNKGYTETCFSRNDFVFPACYFSTDALSSRAVTISPFKSAVPRDLHSPHYQNWIMKAYHISLIHEDIVDITDMCRLTMGDTFWEMRRWAILSLCERVLTQT